MAGENLHLSMLLTAQAEQAKREIAATAQEAQKLARTGPEVAAGMGAAGQATDQTGRETAKYRAELDQLRAKFNPLFAASKQYEAVLGEIAEAERLGALSATEAAAARERAAAGLVPMQAQMRNLARGTQLNVMHSANLAAQFNDIGVMALAAQNPLQLAVQQGTQINQVFGAMGGHRAGLRAIGPALFSIVSPASLATIAVIALGAAGVQWLMSFREEAVSLEDTLAELKSGIEDLDEATRLATPGGISDLERMYGRVTLSVQRLAEAEERAARRRVERELRVLQDTHAGDAGTGVADGFGGVDISGDILELRRRFDLLRSDAAAFRSDLASISTITDPAELADTYSRLIASIERAEAAHGPLNEEQQTFLGGLIEAEALARRLVAIDETRGQRDAARADQLLADLQSEAAIQVAINRFGEESVRVAELRVDAERRTFEETLRTLDVSAAMKDELRRAWEQANGLANTRLAAVFADARAEARAMADEVMRAFGGVQALLAQSTTSLQEARIRVEVADPVEQARQLAEVRMRAAQGVLRDGAEGLDLAALDAQVRTAGNEAAEVARLNIERDRLNRSRQSGARASAQEQEAGSELIASLQSELDLLRETDPVRAEMIRHREVLASATAEERAQVEALIRARNQESEVQQANQRALEGMRDLGRDVLRGMIDDLRNGASAGDILVNALDRVLDRIIEIGTNSLADMLFGQSGSTSTGLLGSLFSGLFGGAGSAGIKVNALGDVVGAPTLFAYGDQPGKLGVMGEAGPEAIMPLTHGMGAGVGARIGGRETTLPLARLASGKLGVALPEDLGARAFATGGAFGYVPPPPAFAQGQTQSGASVVQLQPVLVNNTSVPMQMETEETTDARGQRQQKYILSEAVGEGLATPGGRGARTMKQVYGVGRSARRRQA